MPTKNGQAYPEATALSAFTVGRFRFTIITTTPLRLPACKGSTFHGGFGHAIHAIAPAFSQLFLNPAGKQDLPKPYILIPPLDQRQEYAKGETLQFELILCGNVIQHFPICFAAFDALGQQLGIGRSRGEERSHYRIDRVDYLSAAGAFEPLYSDNHWHMAQTAIPGDEIAKNRNPEKTNRISLNFTTRLRLKENGHLVREAPSFRLVLDRLLGRLHTLSSLYHEKKVLDREERNSLLAAAEAIQIERAEISWDDWSRYSGRQKEWMRFGGLLGCISYRGDITPFMPYLALGEWVHIGGKTSFGLGKIELGFGQEAKSVE